MNFLSRTTSRLYRDYSKRFLYVALFLGVSAISCNKKIINSLYTDKSVYTRVNIRYDSMRNKASYIGYKKLALLPANSKVLIKEVALNGFKMIIPSNTVISFTYKEKWGGKSIHKIMPLLFSDTDISSELSRFSKVEKRGVKIGKALVGMSKNAVIVALGHPPAHITPSIEQDIWTYWLNRIITYQVEFENNKVIAIGKPGR